MIVINTVCRTTVWAKSVSYQDEYDGSTGDETTTEGNLFSCFVALNCCFVLQMNFRLTPTTGQQASLRERRDSIEMS